MSKEFNPAQGLFLYTFIAAFSLFSHQYGRHDVMCKRSVLNKCACLASHGYSGLINVSHYGNEVDCSQSFRRKIVEIENFALQAAISDECQIYLGGEGQFAINPDPHTFGTFETKMAAPTGAHG